MVPTVETIYVINANCEKQTIKFHQFAIRTFFELDLSEKNLSKFLRPVQYFVNQGQNIVQNEIEMISRFRDENAGCSAIHPNFYHCQNCNIFDNNDRNSFTFAYFCCVVATK